MTRIRIITGSLAGHPRVTQDSMKKYLGGSARAMESLTETAATYKNMQTRVILLPVIVSQPSDATAVEGNTAAFTSAATGAQLAYQWYKNNSIILSATSATYTTPALAAGDNGATYKVTVTNPAGTVTSSIVTLTVTSASVRVSHNPSVRSVSNNRYLLGDGHMVWDPNSTSWSDTPPWKAFDGIQKYYDSDYRACGWLPANGQIIYAFPQAVTITKLKYSCDTNASQIARMRVHGSNDLSAWTELMDHSGLQGQSNGALVWQTLDTAGSYKYYRIWCYNATGTTPNTVNVILNELELYSTNAWAGADHLSYTPARSGSDVGWYTKFNNPVNWSVTKMTLGMMEGQTYVDAAKSTGLWIWYTDANRVVQDRWQIAGSSLIQRDPDGPYAWAVEADLTSLGLVIPPNGGIGVSRIGTVWAPVGAGIEPNALCTGGHAVGLPNVGNTVTPSAGLGPIMAKWN